MFLLSALWRQYAAVSHREPKMPRVILTTATVLIDRVIHHDEIILIEGDSYRRRVAEAARKPRRRTPSP